MREASPLRSSRGDSCTACLLPLVARSSVFRSEEVQGPVRSALIGSLVQGPGLQHASLAYKLPA